MGQFVVRISEHTIREYIINDDNVNDEEQAQDWVDIRSKEEINEASESYNVIHSEYIAEATMNIELIPVDED